MTARTYAALFGGAYLALGILGFVPALWERPPSGPALSIRVFYASLFGVFVVNIMLSMVHMVVGLWGVMSANNRYSALIFARGSCVVFLLLGVAGLVPVSAIRTLWGTVPLHGLYNSWVYLGTALIALFFSIRPGYTLTQIGVAESINPHVPHAGT
ncbi:MAG: conserved rane protein of unknown function [Betaproteobacteria bacterium]|nr:conserved rane protein of unknown function [Betaproteobacteria bacterium]